MFKGRELLQRLKIERKHIIRAATGATVLAGLGVGAARLLLPVDLFDKDRLDTGSTGLNMATDVYFRLRGGIPHINTPSLWDSLVQTQQSLTSNQKLAATQVIAPFSAAGAVGMGAISATIAGILVKGGAQRKLIGAAVAGAMGGIAGAYKGIQFGLGVSRIASQLHREMRNLQPSVVDKRAFGGGPGYRSWAKLPGRSMPVGHLGASGDLVLAMHRTRHRSMF